MISLMDAAPDHGLNETECSLLNRTRRMLQFMNGLASLAGPSDLAGTIIGS